MGYRSPSETTSARLNPVGPRARRDIGDPSQT